MSNTEESLRKLFEGDLSQVDHLDEQIIYESFSHLLKETAEQSSLDSLFQSTPKNQ